MSEGRETGIGWTSGSCTVDEVEVAFRRSGGAKAPVILLHGLGGDGTTWDAVARTLTSHADVVIPDARGHGCSSAPKRGYGYDSHAHDLEGLIQQLRLASPVLVGHSMGGMTAALVASRAAAAVSGVVLVDPPFLSPQRQFEIYRSGVAEQHHAWLDLADEEMLADAVRRHPTRGREIIAAQCAARRRTSPAAFEILATLAPDYRQIVQSISAPILLVVGDVEPVVDGAVVGELRRVSPGIRVEEIVGAGHGVPFDQPERLASLVAAFLTDLAGPRRRSPRETVAGG